MEDMGFSITFQIGKVLICLDKSILNSTMFIGVREGTLYTLEGNHVQALVHDSNNLCELWHLHYKEFIILRGIVTGLPEL
jgi:hypothetical protein